MQLAWRRPPPPVVTRWRGLDDKTLASLPPQAPAALAAIIGPGGPQGPKGADGAAQMPEVIDGGNF